MLSSFRYINWCFCHKFVYNILQCIRDRSCILVQPISKYLRDAQSLKTIKLRKRGSSVVSSLAHGARGPRFDPRSRRGKFRSPNTLSLVPFAAMTLDTCINFPLDSYVNWMSPVQGKSPLVQVKEP